MSSAVELWNVSGNAGTEILNNLNSGKDMLKECPPSEFHTHEMQETISRERLRGTFI